MYWAKHGGTPFDDFTFLTNQLQRMNHKTEGSEHAEHRAVRGQVRTIGSVPT